MDARQLLAVASLCFRFSAAGQRQAAGRDDMLAMTRSAFDLDRFIADCRDALAGGPAAKGGARNPGARALRARRGAGAALGEPARTPVQRLYGAPDLTVLDVVWAPG